MRWPERPESGRRPWRWASTNSTLALPLWAGPVGPAVAVNELSTSIPGLRIALLALVEPDERGDPMSQLRWTTKSARNLATELTGRGHPVSADTVAALLRR